MRTPGTERGEAGADGGREVGQTGDDPGEAAREHDTADATDPARQHCDAVGDLRRRRDEEEPVADEPGGLVVDDVGRRCRAVVEVVVAVGDLAHEGELLGVEPKPCWGGGHPRRARAQEGRRCRGRLGGVGHDEGAQEEPHVGRRVVGAGQRDRPGHRAGVGADVEEHTAESVRRHGDGARTRRCPEQPTGQEVGTVVRPQPVAQQGQPVRVGP